VDNNEKDIIDQLNKVFAAVEDGLFTTDVDSFIIETLQSAFDMNFQDKGRHDGSGEPTILSGGDNKWGKLSKRTVASYKKQGIKDSQVTLHRTGALQESISVTGSDGRYKVSAGVPYARRMQLGYSGSVNVPAHTRSVKTKDGTKSVQVKAYSYQVDQKPYPYLVISRDDVLDIIDFVMGG
jgi:phage gpG-like protein